MSRRSFDSGTLQEIGARIRLVRGTLTQAEFAKRISLTRATVANYETGKRLPNALVLSDIAREGKVTVAWLLVGEESRPAGEDADLHPANADNLARWAKSLRAMNERYTRAGFAPGGQLRLDEYLLLRAIRLLTTAERKIIFAPLRRLVSERPFRSFFSLEHAKRLLQITKTGQYETDEDTHELVDEIESYVTMLREMSKRKPVKTRPN